MPVPESPLVIQPRIQIECIVTVPCHSGLGHVFIPGIEACDTVLLGIVFRPASALHSIEERVESAGVIFLGPVVEIHKSRDRQPFRDEIQLLVYVQGYVQLVLVLFPVAVEHIRIRVGIEPSGRHHSGSETYMFHPFLFREHRREGDRIVQEHLVEDIIRRSIRGRHGRNLGIHPEVDLRSRRHLIGDIVLEDIQPAVMVVVEGIVLRYVQKTAVMVGLKGHVVCDLGTSSLYVDVGPLTHGHLLEHKVIPVHVREEVRIDP